MAGSKETGSSARQTWPDSERSKSSKAKAKQPLFRDNTTAKRRAHRTIPSPPPPYRWLTVQPWPLFSVSGRWESQAGENQEKPGTYLLYTFMKRYQRPSRSLPPRSLRPGIEAERVPCVCGNPKTIDHRQAHEAVTQESMSFHNDTHAAAHVLIHVYRYR